MTRACGNFRMSDRLLVRIFSFGYQRSGIPMDIKETRGGFVFDCRFLPNPGREERFKSSTGLDEDVMLYFEQFQAVNTFLRHVFDIIDRSVDNYLARGFTDLMISFGCTGGQHRSVYCAENLAAHLRQRDVSVELRHIELEKIMSSGEMTIQSYKKK